MCTSHFHFRVKFQHRRRHSALMVCRVHKVYVHFVRDICMPQCMLASLGGRACFGVIVLRFKAVAYQHLTWTVVPATCCANKLRIRTFLKHVHSGFLLLGNIYHLLWTANSPKLRWCQVETTTIDSHVCLPLSDDPCRRHHHEISPWKR